MYTIGIDIGGTQTRVALFENHKMIDSSVFATAQNFQDGIENIGKVINGYDKTIVGIGACVPGAANYETGVLIQSGALPGWSGKNVINALRNETGIANIKLENDANLAALGEYVAGEFKGSKYLQFFTISTGLGAGMVYDGKIFTGHNGMANEICNFVVSDDEVGYSILVDGSIEASCSGTGLANQAKKIGVANNAADLFRLAKEGNKDAKFLIDRAIKRLGQLIANNIGMVDPEAIVFSGSVALHNPWFIERAFNYGQSLLMEALRGGTKWGISNLEGLGALYGASYYVA